MCILCSNVKLCHSCKGESLCVLVCNSVLKFYFTPAMKAWRQSSVLQLAIHLGLFLPNGLSTHTRYSTTQSSVLLSRLVAISSETHTGMTLAPSDRIDLPVGETTILYYTLCTFITISYVTCALYWHLRRIMCSSMALSLQLAASLQRFLRRNSTFSGSILSDFNEEFRSKYVLSALFAADSLWPSCHPSERFYGSRYDNEGIFNQNGSNLSTVSRQLANLATSITWVHASITLLCTVKSSAGLIKGSVLIT